MKNEMKTIKFLNVTFKVQRHPDYTGNHYLASCNSIMGNTGGDLTVFYSIDPGSTAMLRTSLADGEVDVEQRQAFMRAITGELTRDHADGYRRMFQALQDHAPGGFLVHCTAGKDRTGVGVALIQLALGVPREVVMEDYLLTNEVIDFETFLLPRLRANLGHDNIDIEGARVLSGVRPEYLNAALDEMERACGSLEAYLEQAMGLGSGQRDDLRDHFLE